MSVSARKTVAIVAAHPLEIAELRKRLESKPFKSIAPLEFLFGNGCIKVILSGIGNNEVRSTLDSLFKKQDAFSALLNVGFAGALDSGLKWGDWVLSDCVSFFGSGSLADHSFSAEPKMLDVARRYFQSKGISARCGQFVTVDSVCPGKEEKEQLFKQSKALVVDMEAFYVGEFALLHNLPFLSLKIVSDGARDRADQAIKSRGRVLSHHIAEVVAGLVTELVDLHESQRGCSNI